jgi:hypothetical protein
MFSFRKLFNDRRKLLLPLRKSTEAGSEHSYNRLLDRNIIRRRKGVQIYNHNYHIFFSKTFLWDCRIIGLTDRRTIGTSDYSYDRLYFPPLPYMLLILTLFRKS